MTIFNIKYNYRIIRIYLFILLFIIVISNCSANEKESETINTVNEYFTYMINNSVGGVYDPRIFYHPDAVWISGDRIRIGIVRDYTIKKIETKVMDINIMNPKDENIDIVDIEIDVLGWVHWFQFIEEQERVLVHCFISYSKGKPLIIDISFPNYIFANIECAKEWLAYEIKKGNKNYKEVLERIESLE